MTFASIETLPKPHVSARRFGARCVSMLTDDALFEACGIRIAFTGREGGVSEGQYAALNLGTHVDDDPAAVERNRRIVLEALGAPDAALVVPNQVHGDVLVPVPTADAAALDAARTRAAAGADGIVVHAPQVAALLCFADCVPVIIASPTGRFAVVHAGWRGVMNGIAAAAARALAQADAPALGPAAARGYNVYLGPHIHAECFEVSAELAVRFADRFGGACVPEARHVDLHEALAAGLAEAGIDRARIADAGVCTRCHLDRYFSYRATGGACGRHGAVAFREAR